MKDTIIEKKLLTVNGAAPVVSIRRDVLTVYPSPIKSDLVGG
jgi:hypothetical protein